MRKYGLHPYTRKLELAKNQKFTSFNSQNTLSENPFTKKIAAEKLKETIVGFLVNNQKKRSSKSLYNPVQSGRKRFCTKLSQKDQMKANI